MTDLAIEIVSAYVSKNHVPAADLPKLIESVYTALSALRSSGKVDTSKNLAV